MTAATPSFDRPPLTETILGLQFEPLRRLRTGHLGEFLGRLGPEWEQLHDAQPLGQTHEPVDREPDWLPRDLQLQLTLPGAPRLRSRRTDRSRIIQVENGWFVQNWNRQGETGYPRYSALSDEFRRGLESFQSIVSERSGETLKPNLVEVGYVNTVPAGELWSRPSEWGNVVPLLFSGALEAAVGELQTTSGRWAVVDVPNRMRLQLLAEHALVDHADPRGALVLRLIARGPVAPGDTLFDRFELAHRMIVSTFAAILSDKARSHWGYRR
jgi:uncharacterized protein (TIGR04255 family)